MRYCPKCKKDKEPIEFYTGDNIPYCKSCWREYMRSKRAEERKLIQEYKKIKATGVLDD